MNAAARALHQDSLFQGNLFKFIVNKDYLLVIVLLIALVVSACCLVYVKNYKHVLYNDLQSSFQKERQLQVDWDQLLLEQSTWAAPARVQSLAQTRLSMHVPNVKEIIVLKSE